MLQLAEVKVNSRRKTNLEVSKKEDENSDILVHFQNFVNRFYLQAITCSCRCCILRCRISGICGSEYLG
jgi:hypothetical protein